MAIRFHTANASSLSIGKLVNAKVYSADLIPFLSRMGSALDDLCARLMEFGDTRAQLIAHNHGTEPRSIQDRRATVAAWLVEKLDPRDEWIDLGEASRRYQSATATAVMVVGLLLEAQHVPREGEGDALRAAVLERLSPQAQASFRPALTAPDQARLSLPPLVHKSLKVPESTDLRARSLERAFGFDALLPKLCLGNQELIQIAARLGSELSKMDGNNDTRGRELPKLEPSAALSTLITFLWSFRREDDPNRLDVSLLLATTGQLGRDLVHVLETAVTRPAPPRPDFKLLGDVVNHLIFNFGARRARPLVDALVRNDQLIPKQLSALQIAKDFVPDGAMAGRGLIAQQHLLPTLVAMIEALIDKGLAPERVFLTGKNYSCNHLVAVYLRMLGVNVIEPTAQTQGTDAFEHYRRIDLGDMLSDAAMRCDPPPAGWTALDDGGMLLQQTDVQQNVLDPQSNAGRAYQDILENITHGVEQTKRGEIVLSGRDLGFPVTMMPQLEAKRREARVIARDLARGLIREARWRGLDPRELRPAIIGAGVVGIELAKLLEHNGIRPCLWDKDPDRRAALSAEGWSHALAGSAADVLAGSSCAVLLTGQREVLEQELAGYSGFLMSGSSDANEVNLELLSTQGIGVDVANRAMPGNFAGDGVETLSASEIGMTRALTFLATALRPAAPGSIEQDRWNEALSKVLDSWVAEGNEAMVTLELDAPPASPPPDRLNPTGRADHDEWMTFFLNHPRRVIPPPTDGSRPRGVYLFEDDDGRLRAVDTRQGRSAPLPADLSGVIGLQRLEGVSSADGTVYCQTPDQGRVLRVLKLEHGRARLGEPLPVDDNVAWRTEPAEVSPALRVTDRFNIDASLDQLGVRGRSCMAARKGDRLYVFSGSDYFRPLTVSLPSRAPSFFLWPDAETMLQIERDTGRMYPISLRPDGQTAYRGVAMPVGTRRVLGVSESVTPSMGSHDATILFEVGSGQQGVVVFTPRGPQATLLPSGAAYRRITRRPDYEGGGYLVEYLPAGVPDESERYERCVIR